MTVLFVGAAAVACFCCIICGTNNHDDDASPIVAPGVACRAGRRNLVDGTRIKQAYKRWMHGLVPAVGK